MPSTVATPAQLTITGAEASTVPARFSGTAASLRITAGSVTLGMGTGVSLTVTTPKLDRIMRQERITEDDKASARFQLIWQRSMEAIENAFAALTTQVGDNTTLLNRILAAQALAQAANDNATEVSDRTSLADSYTDPPSILTAGNDGSIAIAAHERVYGNGDRVSVDAGSVSGFANDADVTVYYKDAARAGGAVLYQGTTSPVSQEGTVHIVGQVTIPAVGQPAATGSGPSAPGYTIPPGSPPSNPYELPP